jgi:hypothetical protein
LLVDADAEDRALDVDKLGASTPDGLSRRF